MSANISSAERRRNALLRLGTSEKEQERARKRHEHFMAVESPRHVSNGLPESKFIKKEVFGYCSRKVRYRTEQDAKKAAKKAFCLRGIPIHAYRCPFCGGYHLTKQKNHKKGERVC